MSVKYSWFLSNSGRKVFPHNVNHEDIDPVCIAKSLSKICRFNGHTSHFYSVAQHSVLVADLLPDEHKFCGLMHDATEAFCGDLIRPIKVHLPDYCELEKGIWLRIAEKYGLPAVMPEQVKHADNVALFTEREQLLPSLEGDEDTTWGMGLEGSAAPVKIMPLNSEMAYLLWMKRWNELTAATI